MTDQNLTHLAIVADRSGSMRPIQNDMNGAIAQLLADQAKQPGSIIVDVTTFDTAVEHPFVGVRPDDIKVDIIHARGMTALNDAIGQTIVSLGERFAVLDEDDRPGHVIVVVVTDGAENASREYTTEQVQAMVTEQTEKWGWTFIYLAANVDAFATGARYGFDAGHTMNYAPSAAGVTRSFGSTSSLIADTRSGLDAEFTTDDRDAAVTS
jgi:uncharacterized protein YegL